MTTIKTKTVLKNLKGDALKDGTEDFTIGALICSVLSGKVSNPARGYQLAKAFATEKMVELKAEDVVFIKEELEHNGKNKEFGFGALVIGQALEILDGKGDTEPVSAKKKKTSDED